MHFIQKYNNMSSTIITSLYDIGRDKNGLEIIQICQKIGLIFIVAIGILYEKNRMRII
jgi:hypothetical protein